MGYSDDASPAEGSTVNIGVTAAGVAADPPEGVSSSRELSMRITQHGRMRSTMNRAASRYYDDDYDGSFQRGDLDSMMIFRNDYHAPRPDAVIHVPRAGTRSGITAIECIRSMPRETASSKVSRFAANSLSLGEYLTGTHGRPTSTFCFFPGCRDDACGDDKFISSCPTCTIALYCSQQHLEDDADRHSLECNSDPAFKARIQERMRRAFVSHEHGRESRRNCFQVRDQMEAGALAKWIASKDAVPRTGLPIHLPFSAYVSIAGRNSGSKRRPEYKILHALVKVFQSNVPIQHQSLRNAECIFWFLIPSPAKATPEEYLSNDEIILHCLTLLSTVVSGATALVNKLNDKPALFPSERFLSYEEELSSQGSLILDEEESRCGCGGYRFNGPPSNGWFGSIGNLNGLP